MPGEISRTYDGPDDGPKQAPVWAMGHDEYREYCRCWAVYLKHLQPSPRQRSRAFWEVMEERASDCKTAVYVWPAVWPNVQQIFSLKVDGPMDAARRFVEAVQEGERRMADGRHSL